MDFNFLTLSGVDSSFCGNYSCNVFPNVTNEVSSAVATVTVCKSL